MLRHMTLTLEKYNTDLGRLTKRGEIHLLQEEGKGLITYIETWGFKPGNGYVKTLDASADNWLSYLNHRLDSKEMTQIDGKNARIHGKLETMLPAQYDAFVLSQLNQVYANDATKKREIDTVLLKMKTARSYEGNVVHNFEMIARDTLRRDKGGVAFDMSDGLMTLEPVAPEPVEAPKETIYQEWGAF